MKSVIGSLPVAAVVNVLLRYAQARYRESRLYVGEHPPIVVAQEIHPRPRVEVAGGVDTGDQPPES